MAQFPDPKVTIKFDGEPAAAAACREKLLAEATKGGYFIAAAHIAFRVSAAWPDPHRVTNGRLSRSDANPSGPCDRKR